MNDDPTNSPGDESVFVVDYIKSNFFRVIFADGFWGGMTPTGKVQIAFWNSRDSIPRQMRFAMKADGEVDDPTFDSRADAIHEVESSVLMDLETAKRLKEWINDLISEVESEELEEET